MARTKFDWWKCSDEDILDVVKVLGIKSRQRWAVKHPISLKVAKARNITNWIAKRLDWTCPPRWSELTDADLHDLVGELGVSRADDWAARDPLSFRQAKKRGILKGIIKQLERTALVDWSKYTDDDILELVRGLKVLGEARWKTKHRSSYNQALARNIQNWIAKQLEWPEDNANSSSVQDLLQAKVRDFSILSDEDLFDLASGMMVSSLGELFKGDADLVEILQKRKILAVATERLGLQPEIDWSRFKDAELRRFVGGYVPKSEAEWKQIDMDSFSEARRRGLVGSMADEMGMERQ